MEEELSDKMPQLDLSKVKNMEAVENTDSEFAENFKKSANKSNRKANKEKFSFVEPISLELPSGGRFYQDSKDKDLKNGIAKLIPMSIAEEEILTNKAYSKNGSTFRILFDTCLASDYPASKLLSYDSIYLMYALRNISYGSDYEFKVKCEECDNSFDYNLNIEEIEFENLKEKVDTRDIKLPISKFTITMHLMRLEDEEEIVKLQNKYKNRDDVSDSVLGIYSRTDSIKDANGDELDPDEYIEFLTRLPTKDRMAISESFANATNDPKVTIICPKCGNEMTMSIPWNVEFFRPA